jgi:hypothetical protein
MRSRCRAVGRGLRRNQPRQPSAHRSGAAAEIDHLISGRTAAASIAQS